jgi:hypothetical protein
MFGKKTKKVIEVNVEARNELIQAGKLKARLEDMITMTDDAKVLHDLEQRIELVDQEIELIVKKAKREKGLKIHTNAKKYNRNNIVVKKNEELDTEHLMMVNGEVII